MTIDIFKLERIAEKETWDEDVDFNAYDFSGGNYDDVYWAGVDDGRTKTVRELLPDIKELLEIKFMYEDLCK